MFSFHLVLYIIYIYTLFLQIIEEFFRKEITYLVTDVNTHDCVKAASSVPSSGLPSPCSMSRR